MSSNPNDPKPPTPEPPVPQPLPPVSPPAWVPPTPPARKSPGLAVVLSFFPGLGHLYLGLYQRGIAFFLAFAGAIFLAEKADLIILVPFAWFFALIDAYRQAQFLNLGFAPQVDAVTAVARVRRGGNLGLGVLLVVVGLLLLYDQFYPIDLSFLADWWPILFVLAGGYLIVQHYLDQKRARRAEVEQSERL